MCFKKKRIVENPKPVEEANPIEEWVWVSGYKGTDRDMKCRDYQYELNKQFDISEDREVQECVHGFHLCLNIGHVMQYYSVHNGNRYFEVKALVRKSDLDTYGEDGCIRDRFGNLTYVTGHTKLVAKSIIFTRELTMDEILEPYGVSDWSEDDKKLVLELGLKVVSNIRIVRELTALGYSEPFANLVVERGRYETAKAVGSQPDLSMDMKCWLIFN